jgi:hypothetical protein
MFSDAVRITVSSEVDDAALRRSSWVRRGNGGQLDQLRRIEEIQTTRLTRVSAMDLATQGDAINPMAPAAHAVTTRPSSRPKPTLKNSAIPTSPLEASGNMHNNSSQQVSVTSNLQPTFSPAQQGSQFGFRLPNGSAVGRASVISRAPGTVSTRSSRSVSTTAPSLRSASTGTQPTVSTAPTSRTSSSGSRYRLPSAVVKRIPPSSLASQSHATSPTSPRQSHRLPDTLGFENDRYHNRQVEEEDVQARLPDTLGLENDRYYDLREGEDDHQARLQDTQALENDGHYDQEGQLEEDQRARSLEPDIDEASPSEDERLAERFLRGGKRETTL